MTDLPLSLSESTRLSIAHRPRTIALLGGPIVLVTAPVALGLALQVNYGSYDPTALRWLTVALLACFIAHRRLGSNDVSQSAGADEPALRMALAVGLAIQFWSLLTTLPMAMIVVHSARDLLPFRAGLIVAGASVALALMPTAGASVLRQRLALAGILSAYFFIGLWVRSRTMTRQDFTALARSPTGDCCSATLIPLSACCSCFPDICWAISASRIWRR